MNGDVQAEVKAVLAAAGIEPRQKLVIGVSGGADSLALAHALQAILAPHLLHVAHLNHSLRPEATAEAEYVAAVVTGWGMPCHVQEADVAGLAQRQGWSIEEAGRHARYTFLARLSTSVGAQAVAVGHNADDQAETVLLHLLRGSGLGGLGGMRPAGPLPGDASVRLLRPLLSVTREVILNYCAQHGLSPAVDASNEDQTYLRNKVRYDLLPYLESYNPHMRRRLWQLADVAAADLELLEVQSETAWQAVHRRGAVGSVRFDRREWQRLPLGLRRRTVRRAIGTLAPGTSEISYRTVEQAVRVAGGPVTGAQAVLPGGVALRVGYEELVFSASAPLLVEGPQLPDGAEVLLPIPGEVSLLHGWRLAATRLQPDLERIRSNEDPWRAYVQVESAMLVVRPRREGERFQPLGMDGRSASLQDVMVNRRVPAAARARWPVVTDGERVVWLVGQQIDERARVRDAAGEVVCLRCYRAAPEEGV